MDDDVPDDTPFRLVALPAHTANIFDWMSYRDDGMQGRLTNVSEEAVRAQYYYTQDVPEQLVPFTTWEKLPWGMADDTKALLKRTMAAEDKQAELERSHILKDRIAVSKPLRLKTPSRG